MLPDLDAIPWKSLTHAYGSAADVPDILRALSSHDGDERQKAFYTLYGNIYHQGTVYEATAYAVPYLIALTEQPDYPAIPDVLSLLEAIAEGSSFNVAHEALGIFAEQRASAEWQIEKQQQLVEVARAHAAVGTGIPLYLTFVSSPDEEIQATALMLLGVFSENYADIVPAIRALLAAPALFSARSLPTALMTLGTLSNGQDADINVIAPYLDDAYAPPVRVAAAHAFAACSPQTIPVAALTILADVLRHPGAYQSEAQTDFRYDPFGTTLASLLRLSPDEAFPNMVGALRELDATVDASDCLALMLACFGIAWFGKERSDYSTGWMRDKDGQIHMDVWQFDQMRAATEQRKLAAGMSLTAHQHAAIAALLECPQFWEIHTNALEVFGLPTQRDELAVFITI